MKRVDFDQNGEINYSEFISGTLDRNLLSKENLWKVFKYLDTNGDEKLTYDSLKQAFQRKGDFDSDLFNKITEEVNLIPSAKYLGGVQSGIDFQKFCEIMGLYE